MRRRANIGACNSSTTLGTLPNKNGNSSLLVNTNNRQKRFFKFFLSYATTSRPLLHICGLVVPYLWATFGWLSVRIPLGYQSDYYHCDVHGQRFIKIQFPVFTFPFSEGIPNPCRREKNKCGHFCPHLLSKQQAQCAVLYTLNKNYISCPIALQVLPSRMMMS